MKIALDAMGGDYAPAETVAGAIQAAREYSVGVILVGDEARLKAELTKHNTIGLDLPIVHTAEAIGMDEHGAQAVKQKKRSSLTIAVELARDGEAAGAVSAGNSGAMMAAGVLLLKRIRGIERPALATAIPTRTGQVLLLDVGANADAKPSYLAQFGLMGSIYMEKIFRVTLPRVGLLSIGEEETKGNQLVLEAYPLLKNSPINFIGNVEGKDIPRGLVDVVVCDGFTGNIALKLAEGLAETLFEIIREEITSTLPRKLAAAALKPAFRTLKRRLDYAEYGGAPLLGVNGIDIVAHGRSNAKAIKNAIRVAKESAEQDLVNRIREGLAKMPVTAAQPAVVLPPIE